MPNLDCIEFTNNEVHRPSGYWSKQVHQLLYYLHEQGFDSVPKPLGFDDKGREIVTFLAGEVYPSLLSPQAASIHALTSAAKLLRAYHDAAQYFLQKFPMKEGWMLPAKEPIEVICHGDFAPYNIVLNGEEAIGIIDFDAAHPGPRAWDVAYALYRFAPFANSDNPESLGSIEEQISRARLFCQAYQLSKKESTNLADLMIERLNALLEFLHQSTLAGNKKYQHNLKEGHDLIYLKDIQYIKQHKLQIQKKLIFT